MAILVKRSSSPFWYARFQVDGKDRWLSTGKRMKDDAAKELKKLVAQAKGEASIDDQVRLLLESIKQLPSESQASKRQEVVRQILRGQERTIPVAEGWSAWRNHSNREYDPKKSTLLGYEAIWKRFANWAAEHKIGFLHEFTHDHAEQYAANLWKSGVSIGTYNAHVKFLRSFFGSLERQAGLIGNCWTHLKSKKHIHADGRRNLTLKELQTVLGRAQGNLRLMFGIGLFTGLRLADVVNLKWSNINSPSGMLACIPVKTSRLNKKVEVPLHPALVEMLRQHKAAAKGEFLFPKERAAHAENASNVTVVMQEFFEQCGIKTTEEAEHGQRRRAIVRVGFHSLRHSFVSLCAKAGTPLHVVQKLVGHGNPLLTSDVYLHLDHDQKREAISNLPRMDENGVLEEAKHNGSFSKR